MLTALAIVGGLAAVHQIHSLHEDHRCSDFRHEIQMSQLREAIEQQKLKDLQIQLEQAAAQQKAQEAAEAQAQAQQQMQQQICDLQQTVDGTNAAVQSLCSAVAQLTQSVHDGQVATANRFCSIEKQLEDLRKEQSYLKNQIKRQNQNHQKGGNNNP